MEYKGLAVGNTIKSLRIKRMYLYLNWLTEQK